MNPKKNTFQTGELPYAKDAEDAILGSLMMYEDTFPDISQVLTPAMFYDHRNQNIYGVITGLDAGNKPIDCVSVCEELKARGLLDKSGGYAYVSKLTNQFADFTRTKYYARIVAQKFIKRELIGLGSQLQEWASNDTVDIGNVLTALSNRVDEVNAMTVNGETMKPVIDYVNAAIDEAFKRTQSAKEGKISGVTTGLTDLDRMTTGFNPGDLVIIAGRPGSGKTSVLLHIAKYAAMTGSPAAIFSLEMPGISLADRLILSETNIDASDYRRGYLKQSDYTEFSKAQEFFSTLPVYVDEKPDVNMQYVKAQGKRLVKQGKCSIILIDYLQLANVSMGKNSMREQDIAAASRQCKIIAKELGVPVILLSQLNRECEKRQDKIPELSDLRESGAIEQDADKVILVYRPEYYGLSGPDGEPIKNVGKLIIAKQRNGPVGEVKFSYNDSLTKIADYAGVKLPLLNITHLKRQNNENKI